MQIGEVAERTGLSLRTIRYYEEMGLIHPSARSRGGFRLYSEADVARLRVIMSMKPLDFSLEEMRQLLDVLDGLAADRIDGDGSDGDGGDGDGERLVAELERFHAAAGQRVEAARTRLQIAEGFARDLAEQVARQREH